MASVENDFDTKAAALLRRRKMAELLQADALKGYAPTANIGRTSFLEPLGQMAKAFAGMHMGKGIDAEEAANEAARETAFKDVMARMPQGTAPTPGSDAMGPPSVGATMGTDTQGLPSTLPSEGYLPESGFQPAVAPTAFKPPTKEQMIPWAADAARTTQTGKDLAKSVYANLIPKELTPYEIEDMKERSALRVATLENTRVNQMAENERKRAAAEAVLADKNSTREAKIIADRERNETDLERARIMAGAMRGRGDGEGGGFKTTTDVDENGRRLVQKGAVYHQVMDDGTINPKPYGGTTTPKTTQEKNVTAVIGSQQAYKQLDDALAAAEKNKGMFDVTQSIGQKLPGDVGHKVGLSNPGAQEARAPIASVMAQRAHALYGAALTKQEQDRAMGFLLGDYDGYDTAVAKLRGLKKMEEEFAARSPKAAQGAAAARTGGAPPGSVAGGPIGGGNDGWGPVKVKAQ